MFNSKLALALSAILASTEASHHGTFYAYCPLNSVNFAGVEGTLIARQETPDSSVVYNLRLEGLNANEEYNVATLNTQFNGFYNAYRCE